MTLDVANGPVLPDAAPSPKGRLLALALGLALGALAVASVVLWQGRSEAPTFAAAQDMADAIGCTDTYVQRESMAGTSSAGECMVNGSKAVLRTFATEDASFAWQDGATWASDVKVHAVVGRNFIALTYDSDTMNVLAPALTQ